MTKLILVVTAVRSKEEAVELSRTVVEKRMAACAQVLGPVTSTYWWKGRIETVEEWLCLMKSNADLYEKLESTICNIHSYEVPEIFSLTATRSNRRYLDWLERELEK